MTGKIRGIIFDLDDTLFDCTGQLTQPARRRAAQILASAHPDLSIETGYQQQVSLSQTHGSSEAIRILGTQYNIPANIVERALNAYNPHTVENHHPFPRCTPHPRNPCPARLSTRPRHLWKSRPPARKNSPSRLVRLFYRG